MPAINLGFCETISDLTTLFMSQPQLPANSRDVCLLVVDWTEAFEQQHADTDWGEVDYLETIDRFFTEQYRVWLETTPTRALRLNT